MSCRSRRASGVLAAVAAAVLGGVLMASPAQAAPVVPPVVTDTPDDFVWDLPPRPGMPGDLPGIPCLPGLPCPDVPDDFVWDTAPKD
ncbi:hypothetical protein ACHGLA_25750 [Streptomyces sp. YH02]|uniref:hypothetical protein n=1 Tax=Streptomyces sp. YH02 TaxID=3256999 RepID=UPI003756B6B8